MADAGSVLDGLEIEGHELMLFDSLLDQDTILQAVPEDEETIEYRASLCSRASDRLPRKDMTHEEVKAFILAESEDKQGSRREFEELEEAKCEKEFQKVKKQFVKRIAEAPQLLDKFINAPIQETWKKEGEIRSCWKDRPRLKDSISVSDSFAMKSMTIMSVAELLQDQFWSLKVSEFDMRTTSFQMPFGNGVVWLLNPMLQHMPRSWSVERMAATCAERYLSPVQFMKMLNMPDDCDIDWETMEGSMYNPATNEINDFSFGECYGTFLNSVDKDEKENIIQKHRQLIEARLDSNFVYDYMIKHGKLLPRVRTSRFFNLIYHDNKFVKCCVQDIENCPEMQIGLVCEHETSFVIIHEPFGAELDKVKDTMWDTAMDNLRRLYVKKSWLQRASIQIGGPGEGKLHCLEAYDVECLSFVATTMFVPERMKQASKLDVNGDLVMMIARDDVVFFTGSRDEWGMAYLAHIRLDMQGNQSYVGAALRLVTLEEGILAWEYYRPRTANEIVLPRNRVEVDLLASNVRLGVKPIGCAFCYSVLSKLLICARCHDIFYCSKDCQTAHWKSHKKYCIKRTGKQTNTASKKALRAANHPKMQSVPRPHPSSYTEDMMKSLPKKYHSFLKKELGKI